MHKAQVARAKGVVALVVDEQVGQCGQVNAIAARACGEVGDGDQLQRLIGKRCGLEGVGATAQGDGGGGVGDADGVVTSTCIDGA